MLIIRKNQTNNLIATVSMNKTLASPYYLFSFQHIASKERVSFIPQVITSNCRYDKFRFVESPTTNLSFTPPNVNFFYEGQYYYSIYEQVQSGNTNPALAYNKLESGRAVVIVDNDHPIDCFFEPYISQNEDFGNYIYISEQEQECAAPPSPSVTPTPTVTPSCPITTQYLKTLVVGGNKIRLTLWNDSGYTSQAEAICDYTVSGTMSGSSGTTYTSTRTFTTGDHQIEFNFTPYLQSGEVITYHSVLSVDTSLCSCPVVVNFTYLPPP